MQSGTDGLLVIACGLGGAETLWETAYADTQNFIASQYLQRSPNIMSLPSNEASTKFERRQNERRHKDPHHSHPMTRVFIGPSPVSSGMATQIASAMAYDIQHSDSPALLNIIGGTGYFTTPYNAGRGSSYDLGGQTTEWADMNSNDGPLSDAPTQVINSNLDNASSNDKIKIPRSLSPLTISAENDLPRRTRGRDGFGTSPTRAGPLGQGNLGHVSSDDDGGILRRDGHAEVPASDRENVKFSVKSTPSRRHRSEDAFDHNRHPPLHLLDISVNEEAPEHHVDIDQQSQASLGDSRHHARRRWHSREDLPSSGSAPNLHQRSSISSEHTNDVEQYQENVNIGTTPEKDLKTTRGEQLRYRARQRYARSHSARIRLGIDNGKEGNTSPADIALRRQHFRDASKQSHKSHASTLNSVGTRYSEGSFGATGGFRSRLIKKLGNRVSGPKKVRSPSTHSAHARLHRKSSSNDAFGGVVAGAIGTSTGGTKWVGQTFQVGKRFWEAIEFQEKILLGDGILEVEEEEDQNNLPNSRVVRMDQEQNRNSIVQSPSDVLESFARQASGDDTQDVKRQEDMVESRMELPLSIHEQHTTPALDVSAPSETDRSNDSPSAPSLGSKDMSTDKTRKPLKNSDLTSGSDVLDRRLSATSLLTLSHDKELPPIENRRGWSDVVNFMSTHRSLAGNGESPMQEAKKRLGTVLERQHESRRIHSANDATPAPNTWETVQKSVEQHQKSPPDDVQRLSAFKNATSGWAREDNGLEASKQVASAADMIEHASNFNFDSASNGSRQQLNENATRMGAHEREIGSSYSNQDKETSVIRQGSILQSQGNYPRVQQKRSVQFDTRNRAVASPRAYPENEDRTHSVRGTRPSIPTRSGDAAPAPPEEVLSRQGSSGEVRTKQATFTNDEGSAVTNRTALKRDRMLVKVAWTPSEDLPQNLTENESHKFPLHSDPFREFMVVYRMGRLELWEDPSWAARTFGHSEKLHLHLVAPLRRGRTFLSLYSAIDGIFCVSFQLTHHRSLFNLRRSGTHVWLFNARSMSNGADWIWELWRELGGEISPFVDIHLPVADIRIRIPIPDQIPIFSQKLNRPDRGIQNPRTENDNDSLHYGEGYKLISRANVIDAVKDLACRVGRWKELMQKLEDKGLTFALAWRNENKLQWIIHDSTIDGQRRDWTVLVGALLAGDQSPSVLEFRAAVHYPSSVRTPLDEEMKEPHSVEGFLWRVKAVSGSLTRVYVSTHDGLLFVSRPSRAFPPGRFVVSDPTSHRRNFGTPGTEAKGKNRRGSAENDETLEGLGRRLAGLSNTFPYSLEEIDARIDAYKSLERRRQYEQITRADGYIDVRDIVSIHLLNETQQSVLGQISENNVNHTSFTQDDGDIGGEEGLDLAEDRGALKRRRQFELRMTNGRTVKFEAYSTSVAHQWVEHLTEIVQYWKRREKVDALDLMSASGYDLSLIRGHCQDRKIMYNQAPGKERTAPILGKIWNWCVIEGCRGIIRSGRLFVKKKPYGAFTSRYCVLIGGRLLTYKLMTSTRTARSRQNAGIFHRRQETVIHLRDAYVYSGQLTEHMLVNGRSQGAGAIGATGGFVGGLRHTLPRVYRDGLLSIDDDEDCTFVIRYRPQRVQAKAPIPLFPPKGEGSSSIHSPQSRTRSNKGPSTTQIPLNLKPVYHIALRARSRLERDLWVWAINTECERTVRKDHIRESQLRNDGSTEWKPQS